VQSASAENSQVAFGCILHMDMSVVRCLWLPGAYAYAYAYVIEPPNRNWCSLIVVFNPLPPVIVIWLLRVVPPHRRY
jgi:hypothetical protein